MTADWHIFCRVVDNLGDIGISWRLATRLDALGAGVTVIVDDLPRWQLLVRNAPETNITVMPWRPPFPPPATQVIEAFGCGLPEDYRARMPLRTRHWFILDYFSAESWVTGAHGLPSPQANGLTAQFIYPSIHPETGGLLREPWLGEEQTAFCSEAPQWRAQWHIPEPQGRSFFLFGYEQPALSALLTQWADHPQPRTVYFADGRLLDDARRQLGRALNQGQPETWGNLRLIALPFVPQRQFDRLLWQSEVNIVRGEDSLTRAIWAGKPFIWHIYPTDDGAHWQKLDALLAVLGAGLDRPLFDIWRQINHDWNANEHHAAHWAEFEAMLPRLSAYCADLPQRLRHTLPELAEDLMRRSTLGTG